MFDKRTLRLDQGSISAGNDPLALPKLRGRAPGGGERHAWDQWDEAGRPGRGGGGKHMLDAIGTTRRGLLKGSAALAGPAASGALFAPAAHAAKAIKLGYVSPRSGPLAAFAEADDFIIRGFLETVKGGLALGKGSYPVEVVVKDSQSDPNRAAAVAKD